MFAAVDLPLRSEMIHVTIAYTLLGAVVATAALIAASFAGTLQLTPATQRTRLFVFLGVLVAITGAAFLSGAAQFSPRVAQDAIERPWQQENQTLTKNLAISEEAAKSLAAEKETLTRSLAQNAEQVTQLTSAKEQLQARLEKVQANIALAQTELGEAQAKITKNTAEIEDLKLASTRSKEQLDAKNAQMEELGLVRDALAKTVQDLQAALLKAELKVAKYHGDGVRSQVEGRILAVDPGWNFVVMNIGDRSGVKAGAPLLVTREGQLIAKVQAKSVEPGQTVADILGGSEARKEKIQPGDTVIFPAAAGSR